MRALAEIFGGVIAIVGMITTFAAVMLWTRIPASGWMLFVGIILVVVGFVISKVAHSKKLP